MLETFTDIFLLTAFIERYELKQNSFHFLNIFSCFQNNNKIHTKINISPFSSEFNETELKHFSPTVRIHCSLKLEFPKWPSCSDNVRTNNWKPQKLTAKSMLLFAEDLFISLNKEMCTCTLILMHFYKRDSL